MRLSKRVRKWEELRGRSLFEDHIAKLIRGFFENPACEAVEIWHDDEAHLASHDADDPNQVYVELWGRNQEGCPEMLDCFACTATPRFIAKFFPKEVVN